MMNNNLYRPQPCFKINFAEIPVYYLLFVSCLIFLLLCAGDLRGQKPQGVWIISYIRNDANSQQLNKAADNATYASDTTTTDWKAIDEIEGIEELPYFGLINVVFDFKVNTVIGYGLGGGKKKSIRYNWKNDTLRMKMGGLRLIGYYIDSSTLVLSPKKKKRRGLSLILKQLPKPNQQVIQRFKANAFEGKNWRITADSTSCLYPLEMYTIDSTTTYFTIRGNCFGYTGKGILATDIYEDYMFLLIKDENRMIGQMFFVHDRDTDKLLAVVQEEIRYRQDDFSLAKKTFLLEEIKLLTKVQLDSLHQQLLGTWQAKHLLDTTSLFTQARKSIEQDCQISFLPDKRFKITIAVDNPAVTHNIGNGRALTIEGTYSLSPTGTFLELYGKSEDEPFYETMTIGAIRNDSLIEVWGGIPFDGIVYIGTPIELKKSK